MSVLDFDYLIVSNQHLNDSVLKETFSYFCEIGIRTFVFTVSFDHNHLTVSMMQDRIRQIKQLIRANCPRGIKYFVCADVLMTEGISSEPFLSRMTVNRSDAIFLRLPIFCEEDWINTDLNGIIFRQHCRPIFSCFESNLKTNPEDQLNRLMSSKSFRACIDLNYITSISSREALSDLIKRNTPLLPCISHSLSDYAGVMEGFEDLKRRLGNELYVALCRNIHQSKFHILPLPK